MPKKVCCPSCFGDSVLRTEIFPTLNYVLGDCGYCGSKDQMTVDPSELNALFELVTAIYEPGGGGESIVEWLKRDWDLFSHETMDVAHAKELLAEVLDSGEFVRTSVVPSAAFVRDSVAEWAGFCRELQHSNRWFLETRIDEDRLKSLFSMLIAVDLPNTWYRARLQEHSEPYSLKEMGAPPKEKASHGRANPPGIPYLYLGSQPDTAVAEVRPHTGEVASVAEFLITDPIVVDLRSPRTLISPFILGDVNEVGALRADVPFLERLGVELTKPVLPTKAAIDYIPSQYLCEFIKMCGFDGVAYSSSVSDGFNLALFDASRAQPTRVAQHLVETVSVSIGGSFRLPSKNDRRIAHTKARERYFTVRVKRSNSE